MKYTRFLSVIRKNKLYIFTANDLVKYFPSSSQKTIQNQIQLWVERGLIIRLKRGLYQIQFPEGGPALPDLYIANKLYAPSYISLETALSFYNFIPEVSAGVTSITTRQTRAFNNKFGYFKYSSCKNDVYCGYRIMPYEGFEVYIAEKEKAIVDFVYFKNRRGEGIYLDAERFDEVLLKKLSWRKVYNYARLFNKKTLLIVKSIRNKLK